MLTLANDTVEVIASQDFGPRILSYRFLGGENILGAAPDAVIRTRLGDWKAYGGHRLWIAPESNPESYSPDNEPCAYEDVPMGLKLTGFDRVNQFEKVMELKLESTGAALHIRHTIKNTGRQARSCAPWAITIMKPGGFAVLPQEPYKPWSEYLLPARPMVLWHYTRLDDPRWNFMRDYIVLHCREEEREPQKIGLMNKRGWSAYYAGDTAFLKKFDFIENETYPDYGSNNEVYTAGPFIELESLGPLRNLGPGEVSQHDETWRLFRRPGAVIGGAEFDSLLKIGAF